MIPETFLEYIYQSIYECLAYMDSIVLISAWGLLPLTLFGAITSSIIFTAICGLIWQAVTPTLGEEMHDGL